MKNLFLLLLGLSIAIPGVGGCGGSSGDVETTAEQDELSQWVAENPETDDEVDPDA
ncbi:MAG: hypothetical protein AAGJ40_19475 [Planctomycetota bacterium]